MVFTESDAQNDGLIKREVGREMAKVAKTQNPQMFQHFERVCDEVGRQPAEVFGEMAVRALNNEEYAKQVLDSEVSMGQIKADEIRLEDVKYVKELSEELGLNDSDDSKDPIDQLINQRLEMVTQSPFDNIRKGNDNPEGVNGQILDHMESLQREINNMKDKIEGDDMESSTASESSESSNKSVDDLFDGGGDGSEQEQEQTEDESEQPEFEEVNEVEVEVEEEEQAEPEPSDSEINEALEGTVGSVDDAWEDDSAEELDEDINIPVDGDEEQGFITSEDGEEE